MGQGNQNQQRSQPQGTAAPVVEDVQPSNKPAGTEVPALDTAAVASEPSAEAQAMNEGLTEAEKREIAYARTRKHEATYIQPSITPTSHKLVRMLNTEPLDGIYIQWVHPFCVAAHEEKGWHQAPLDD